jgi:hypothetical protein
MKIDCAMTERGKPDFALASFAIGRRPVGKVRKPGQQDPTELFAISCSLTHYFATSDSVPAALRGFVSAARTLPACRVSGTMARGELMR